MPSGRLFNSGQYANHITTRLSRATWLSCKASPIISHRSLGNESAGKYNFFPS
jgi:hypothetical protein